MKTLIKITFITGCIFLAACTKKQTAEQLLKDDKMRAELMTAICNDSEMTTEMIHHMSITGTSQKMLPLTCNMLEKIMSSDIMKNDTMMQNTIMTGMLHLISRDSVLCDKTCTRMVEDPHIKRAIEKKI